MTDAEFAQLRARAIEWNNSEHGPQIPNTAGNETLILWAYGRGESGSWNWHVTDYLVARAKAEGEATEPKK